MPDHIDRLAGNLKIERWQAVIVHDRMVNLGEEFPADPNRDDTYCCSAHELEMAFACCIEAVIERQEAERSSQKEHAHRVARQLFDWLDYEETSPMTRGEFLSKLAKQNPWLTNPTEEER